MADNYNQIAEANGWTQSKPEWIDVYYNIDCKVFQIMPSPYGKYPLYEFATEILMEFEPFFNQLPSQIPDTSRWPQDYVNWLAANPTEFF